MEETRPVSSWQRYVVYREKVYAVDEKVLVGNNEHQAFVARPVREGDDTVLVRWESTGAREEVAVGDVKKIDLDAKRPRRKRRDASGAEAAAPARREPPGKRRKKKADADDDESSSVDKTPSVAEIRAAYQREQEAARAAASDAEEDAGAEDPSSAREEIELHVKTLQSGDPHGAFVALEKLAEADADNRAAIARRLVGLLSGGSAREQKQTLRVLVPFADSSATNKAAIVEAGAIEALVALLTNGVADDHFLEYLTVWALRNLAHGNDANRAAIATALVALVGNGAAGGQERAVVALRHLAAYSNTPNQAAIVEAGGVEALVALVTNGSDGCEEKAVEALRELGLLGKRFSQLLSENASLKRRLGEEDVVSLRDGEAPLPSKESSALRDAHDKQQTAVLRRVKEEKVDAERACDRTDAVAAAASAAAATATADAREATEELEDVHDDFVNPLTLTVNALQTKIDELHALASQVDPVAADAIKTRQN